MRSLPALAGRLLITAPLVVASTGAPPQAQPPSAVHAAIQTLLQPFKEAADAAVLTAIASASAEGLSVSLKLR